MQMYLLKNMFGILLGIFSLMNTHALAAPVNENSPSTMIDAPDPQKKLDVGLSDEEVAIVEDLIDEEAGLRQIEPLTPQEKVVEELAIISPQNLNEEDERGGGDDIEDQSSMDPKAPQDSGSIPQSNDGLPALSEEIPVSLNRDPLIIYPNIIVMPTAYQAKEETPQPKEDPNDPTSAGDRKGGRHKGMQLVNTIPII